MTASVFPRRRRLHDLARQLPSDAQASFQGSARYLPAILAPGRPRLTHGSSTRSSTAHQLNYRPPVSLMTTVSCYSRQTAPKPRPAFSHRRHVSVRAAESGISRRRAHLLFRGSQAETHHPQQRHATPRRSAAEHSDRALAHRSGRAGRRLLAAGSTAPGPADASDAPGDGAGAAHLGHDVASEDRAADRARTSRRQRSQHRRHAARSTPTTAAST